MSYTDQVVVVTGAARGIGFALAERYAAEGARVVLLDINSELGATSADRLNAVFYPLDVRDSAAVERVVQAIDSQFGRIDIWINNAGVAHKGLVVDLTPDDWNADIGVMLSGPFYCARAVGKVMIRQRSGIVVNVASVNGLLAQKARAPYCSAKAGLIMLTKVLACEWAEYGIRVNAIAPGVVMTDLVQQGIDQGLVTEQTYISRIPMGRMAEMNEIVEAVLFLTGDESTFMTGEVMRVDGGWTSYHLFYPYETAF